MAVARQKNVKHTNIFFGLLCFSCLEPSSLLPSWIARCPPLVWTIINWFISLKTCAQLKQQRRCTVRKPWKSKSLRTWNWSDKTKQNTFFGYFYLSFWQNQILHIYNNIMLVHGIKGESSPYHISVPLNIAKGNELTSRSIKSWSFYINPNYCICLKTQGRELVGLIML